MVDAALIGGETYQADIYVGAFDSTYYLPVHGRQIECQGCQVYADGSYSGQGLAVVQGTGSGCASVYDHRTGTYGIVCGLREMKSSGQTICQIGDSGGPVYVNDGNGGALAVGLINGFTSATDCWYTEIEPVPSHWSLEVSTQ